MHSLTKNISSASLQLLPFPHVVVDNVLDKELYEKLEREYPFESKVEGYSGYENNERYQISAVDALREQRVSPLWKEFIRYHVSKDFLGNVCTLFSSGLKKYYPEFSSGGSTGVRFIDTTADTWMDCQPGINSPVREVSSVKGPHLDHPSELFAGLLYFRHPEDSSTGGDLELYRYKASGYHYGPRRFIEERFVEKVGSVSYAPNRLVLFLNTIDSVHGVSPRSVTPFTRRLCNFIGESGHGSLFTIPTKISPTARAKSFLRGVIK